VVLERLTDGRPFPVRDGWMPIWLPSLRRFDWYWSLSIRAFASFIAWPTMCSMSADRYNNRSIFAALPNNVESTARGGSRKVMSIFDLHSAVLADYRGFIRSFFTITDERAQQFVEHALVAEAQLWPDFLLQVSPAYARAATVGELG